MDKIPYNEFLQLMRESVKANTTNAEATKAVQELLKNQEGNLRQLNDQFVFHCNTANDISKEVKMVKEQLLKWLKWCIIVIFTLLGGIIFAKALGLDIIELIKK